MLGRIENIKIISSIKNISKPYKKTLCRKNHGFVYRLSGFVEYYLDGRVIRVNEGEIVFLPKDSAYELRTSNQSEYLSLSFEGDIENPEISVYSLKEYSGAKHLCDSFADMWQFGNDADRYKCLSDFYDLLSYISRIDQYSDLDKENYKKIEPGVEYLKAHLFDSDLRVNRLHRLCGISDTYFRKIFSRIFSQAPQEYIVKERLSRALLILESGDFKNIGAVAESVGYTDPLYFSKAFHKMYGFAPSALSE